MSHHDEFDSRDDWPSIPTTLDPEPFEVSEARIKCGADGWSGFVPPDPAPTIADLRARITRLEEQV
jgi:hypothetical protein